MQTLSYFIEQIQHRLFHSVISNNLVYNTCWEDPRTDRRMLQLTPASRILMLTSAGDNALDYLLDDPEIIDCVDINPAQTALLDLKKSLFAHGTHNLLWEFFGEGKKDHPEQPYARLRKNLPSHSRSFWDRQIGSFIPTTEEPSFYYRGTAGKIALMFHKRIRRKGLYPQIQKLLKSQSLEEQAYYFEEIEPQLWSSLHHWLVPRQAVMTMLGVPAAQRRLIRENYEGGILQYIRHSLREVFTKRPIEDNYFWRVYLTGSYSPHCCPNYLRPENYSTMAKRINRIRTRTTSLLDYLRQYTGPAYSHMVLLDHQDWLAHHDADLLAEEWDHLLKAAAPGTRILFRSATSSVDFLPEFVHRRVCFQTDLAGRAHNHDRVGTYESTCLAIVK